MRNIKAFTLIELVLIIVVIGILSAIVIPMFANISKNARIGVVQAYAGAINSLTVQGRGLAQLKGIDMTAASGSTVTMGTDTPQTINIEFGWPDFSTSESSKTDYLVGQQTKLNPQTGAQTANHPIIVNGSYPGVGVGALYCYADGPGTACYSNTCGVDVAAPASTDVLPVVEIFTDGC